VRRAHPLVFVAAWAVVALLAVAGFAAFQIQGRDAPPPSNDALGREVGALAGLGFNAPKSQVVAVAATTEEEGESAGEAEPTTEDLMTSVEAEEADPVDTVPSHGWLSEMQVRALIGHHFQEEDVNRAIRVAWCQSRFNPTSTNTETGGTGLFHHLPEFWPQRAAEAGFPDAAPTDPEANVAAAAHAIYDEGGWAVFPCSS
jgi:hypothetical protein